MVESGDPAPDFTAPLASGNVETFTLSEALSEGPVVLAFFPGAFTSTCRSEMVAFQDRLSEFDAAGARVVGISRDSPFALNEFRDQNGLEFGLVSDLNGELVEQYGLEMDFEDIGVRDLAKRSVFVVDGSRTVTYDWVSDDPGIEPDYDEVLSAVEAAAE